MMSSLLLLASLFCLASTAPSTPSSPTQSFSFKASSHRLAPEVAAALNKERINQNPQLRSIFDNKSPLINLPFLKDDATSQGSLNLTDYYQYALIANITVGTPPKQFSVHLDLWSSDMSLVDVSAAVDTEYCGSSSGCSSENDNLAAKNPYNASVSSTSTTSTKKFRGSYEAGDKGTITKDNVNLGGVTAAVSFGDLTQVGYMLDILPIDGTLGISALKSKNKISNVLQQIVSNLTSPVVTLHLNRTITDSSAWPNTDAEVMFGSNALPQCNSANWVTFPLASKPIATLGQANATSISITDTSKVDGPCNNAVLQTSHPLLVVDYFTMMSVSVQALDVFKKASGAVYDITLGLYTVDCTQLDTRPTVSIGLSDGSAVVLRARDYVLDLSNTKYNVCLLFVSGAYDEGDQSNQGWPILLGQNWLNNNCISYDINANTLSYTDALPNNGQ